MGYSFKHLVRSPKTIYIREVKSPVQGHVRGRMPRELPLDKAKGPITVMDTARNGV